MAALCQLVRLLQRPRLDLRDTRRHGRHAGRALCGQGTLGSISYFVEIIIKKSKVKPLFGKSSNALNLDIVALSSKDGVDLRDGGGSLVLDGSATESEELCVGPGHAGILSAQSSSAITGTWFSPVASQTIRNTITMGWLL